MIAIGRMEKADLGEVEALAAEAGLRTYEREWFAKELASDGALFLVARDAAGPGIETRGRVLGALLGRLVLDELEIDDLVVAPEARRRGIAKSLITFGAKLAVECGVKRAVLEVLKEKKALKDQAIERVVFNAITKQAVSEAMKHPRTIDHALVDAYLARRALDYLVGFTLSPVLWRKLPGARSAGRVQ